ncbi:MAG: M64 family metallopeptidase [Kofleriaceae bacterium]
MFAAGLALAACSGGDDQLDPDVVGKGGAKLELLFGEGRLELARSQPMAEAPTELGVPANLGTSLRWEMLNRQGVKLAEGSAPDTRILNYEPRPDEPMPGPSKAKSGTLNLEIPDAAGTLRLFDNTGKLLGELSIERSAQAYSADGWTGKADIDWETDLVGDPVLVNGDGVREGKFTLLFVPEGYTEAELPKFEADVASMWSLLKDKPIYKEHMDQLNAYRQNIKSAESGVSDPRGNANKDTAFNVAFGDDVESVRRCLWPSSNWRTVSVANVNRLKETVGADVVIIVANTDEWGGCSNHTLGLVVQPVYSAQGAADALAHELGHALFGLADEYSQSGGAFQCGHTGPNLTRSLSYIPWQDLIEATTPIPTTYSQETQAKVGAWEGGGYCTTGTWRPALSCMMLRNDLKPCPVCTRIAETKFKMKRDPNLMGQCAPTPAVAFTASADDGNKPVNVADGKITTRWSSNGIGQWLQLDLGGNRTISAIDLAWYKGKQRKSNYVVSTSVDGVTFADVAAGQSNGVTEYKERVGFSPIEARYVRVTVNGNTANSWASITEAAVCALPVSN